MCYSLLLRLLRSIDAEWDPTVVRGDLVGGSEMSGDGGKLRPPASFSFPPFLCAGAASVGQLPALHGALPVPDEEHAAGFPVRQHRRHCALRAHAEVKPPRPTLLVRFKGI